MLYRIFEQIALINFAARRHELLRLFYYTDRNNSLFNYALANVLSAVRCFI